MSNQVGTMMRVYIQGSNFVKTYIGPDKETVEYKMRHDAMKYGYLNLVPLTEQEVNEIKEKENESNTQVSKSGSTRKQRSTKKNRTKHGV